MLRIICTLGVISALTTGTLGQRSSFHENFDPLDVTGPRTAAPFADGPTFRLPNDTRPIRYDIDLQTWVDQGRFDFLGEVKIHFRVVAPHTNTITVHSSMQVIFRTELRTLDGRVIPTWPHQYDPTLEFLTVQTRSGFLLEHEEYILELDYTATLRSDDQGFYRSSYVNEQGQTV
jgi:aminopeptidase N